MANPGLSRRDFLLTTAAAASLPVGLPAAVASAQAKSPRLGGTFISAKTTEAPSLEPNLEQALSRHRIDPLFYNRLVEWSAEGKLEPSLAQSWTTSADGKTWTFKLRQGVKFHNGREFVADDVKYSYERVLDPEAGLGRARLSLGHRADRRGGQAHGAHQHQAAERVAPRGHGGELVLHRAA
jgi:peptide/nickel transport system substrate-binding protein